MYNLNVERRDAVLIASPQGRLDGDNARDFKAALDEFIIPNDKVILNLQDISYMSSAGLRILAMLSLESKKTGYAISTCSPTPAVDYVLRTSGFYNIITVHPTMEDATGEDATGEDATGEDATGEDATGEDATGEDATGEDATGEDATGTTLADG